jgi:hypothetical protein
MIEKTAMKDSKIQGEVQNYVGDADIHEAFESLDEAGEGQIKFKDFVNWAFDKNMVIEFEKEKERQTMLEFTEDQEVDT